MTNRLEPINVFNALLEAERSGQVDFTQHGYPLVYGVLVVSIVLLATPLMPIGQTTSANIPLVPAANEIAGPSMIDGSMDRKRHMSGRIGS